MTLQPLTTRSVTATAMGLLMSVMAMFAHATESVVVVFHEITWTYGSDKQSIRRNEIVRAKTVNLNSFEITHVLQQNQTDSDFIMKYDGSALKRGIERALKSNPTAVFRVCDGNVCIRGQAKD